MLSERNRFGRTSHDTSTIYKKITGKLQVPSLPSLLTVEPDRLASDSRDEKRLVYHKKVMAPFDFTTGTLNLMFKTCSLAHFNHIEGVLSSLSNSCCSMYNKQLLTKCIKDKEQSFIFSAFNYYYSADFLLNEIVKAIEKTRGTPVRRVLTQVLKDVRKDALVKGVRISCSGPLGRKGDQAKTIWKKYGHAARNTFDEKVDYASGYSLTRLGKIGVKVLICYGGSGKKHAS